MEESAAVVRQRPAELQILPDESLRRRVARDGLELLDQSRLRRVLGASAPPRHARRPVGAPSRVFRQKSVDKRLLRKCHLVPGWLAFGWLFSVALVDTGCARF